MPTKRILTIDLLRGYFLFMIIINHLYRFPAFYEFISGKSELWTSSAEGFFLISGMMIGLIRGRKEIKVPMFTIIKKLYLRCGILYFWAVALTIIFTVIGMAYSSSSGIKYGLGNFVSVFDLLGESMTFQYVYGWADFLQYYVVFLLFSPIAIFLLRKKLWGVILFISLTIWFIWAKANPYYTTWQLLFFSGAILGFYLYEIQAFFINLTRYKRNIINISILSLSVITLLLCLVQAQFYDIFVKSPISGLTIFLKNITPLYFDKPSLPFPRIIIFALWFAALFILFHYFEKPIKRYFGKFLLTLGKNSLFVYIFHGIVIYFVNLFIPYTDNIFLNFLLDTAVLYTIYSATVYKDICINYALIFVKSIDKKFLFGFPQKELQLKTLENRNIQTTK